MLESGLQFLIRGFISAAQEKGLKPKPWVRELEQQHWQGDFPTVRNVIATLRYDGETVKGIGYPPGEEYVEALLNAGWNVRALVSFGESARHWVRVSGFPHMEIPDSAATPTNATAEKIRKAFGWK